MNIHKVQLVRRRAFAVILLMLATIVSTSHAQRFEELFGRRCAEQGYGGTPLARGGYAAVGFTNSTTAGNCGGTEDVFIVCLKANGSLNWSHSYNLGGIDVGHDIRQCANGDLIVVASTFNNPNAPGQGDLAILRVNSANGALIWCTIYGTSTLYEYGNRIIETTLSAGGSSSAGDFVVAGWQSGGTNGTDALLMRVTFTGGVVWEKTYNGGGNDQLAGLDESTIGNGASDIVAVGSSTSFNRCDATEGLILRVNGATGSIGASPQGAAVYGRGPYIELNSVDELTMGNNRGNLVAAGAMLVASSSDIFVLETTADPCTTVVDATYGDADSTTELANSIREIKANGGLNDGNVIIAGVSKWFTEATGAQGFLLELDPNLNIVTPPTGVGYRLYGPGVEKVLWGEPVYGITGSTTPGFFIIGYSESFPITLSDQLYVVKTDNLGYSNCHDTAVTPYHLRPRIRPNCVSMEEVTFIDKVAPRVRDSARKGDTVLCNDTLHIHFGSTSNDPGLSGIERPPVNVLLIAGGGTSNPVAAGATLTLGYRNAGTGRLVVVVVDRRGREVYRGAADANGELTRVVMSTTGWQPGAYVITATDGDRSYVDHIALNER